MSQDTFSGVSVGEETTVFYRQTEQGIEGFVVDDVSLVQTLKHRVLEERGLSELVDVTSVRGDTHNLSFGHSHRFAEPFSSVTAQLRLAPLDVPWFEDLLVPLTLCVALLLVLGLWSLYRVVKTQLEFAQRRSNFVSAVTHELKTPLTAIRLHGEMLQEGLVDGPEKAQQYYSTITAQTERLSRLIENVLLFSQIEKSSAPVTKQDVGAVVRQVQKTLGPHIERSGFKLQADIPENSVEACFNADHLEQILFNLIENALKYASAAEDRRITVAVDAGSCEVAVSVRDRGPGVSPSLLSKVFEPFFRAEDEMTREHQGSGLGLALVQGLATQMGGRVRAECVHPGLKVSLYLPKSDSPNSVKLPRN